MDKHVLRETKGYKIGYLSITIFLSALVVYLYTISNTNNVDIHYIYFFIYLVVVYLAIVVRKIIVDIVSLLYLLFFLVYYFL